MHLLELSIQPPYDDQTLDNICKKQLQPHPVPDGYRKQLHHHLQAFPQDYLFQLIPHQGDGFGVIKCLEPGCSSDPIVLRPRTSKSDGGRSIGVGGLAEFQSHILEHERHELLRERRIQRKGTPIPRRIQQSSRDDIRTSPATSYVPSPLASSKRALQSPSGKPPKKKIHSSASDSNHTPSQARKSSIIGSTPSNRNDVNPPHQENAASRLRDSNSSDSEICIITGSKTEQQVDQGESSDHDEVMVWVDGEGLVPVKQLSKPQASTKRPLVSDMSNSISHKSPFSDRTASPTKSQINAKLNDSPSPSKRSSSGHKSLLDSQATGPSTTVDEKPLPVQMLNIQKYLGGPSADFPKASSPLNPNHTAHHIDPSLLTFQSSSPSPSVASKTIRKSTPDLANAVFKTKRESTPASARVGSKTKPESTPASVPSKMKPESTPASPSVVPKMQRESTPAYTTLPGSNSLPDLNSDVKGIHSTSEFPRSLAGSSTLLDVKPSVSSHVGIDTTLPDYTMDSLNIPNHLSPSGSLLRYPAMSTSIPNPLVEIRTDELQAFYKRAVEGIDFSHNASVEKARKDLGISEDSDARMDGLSVMLMPHQLIGVSWMIQKENNQECGGILADEMGLGKTIQMVATVVKNRSNDPKIKATLVLAPLALLTQWEEEIADKVTCDLKVLIYHQSFSKPTEKKVLASYDIVITTLDTLGSDWDDNSKVTSATKKPRGLFKVDWYRVVIDEAQIIRNPNAKKSRAVCSLRSTYRWCLTGTPIFNGLLDIFPYLRFLRIRPYNDMSEFRTHIARYEKSKPNLATKRAQAVLATCMIRRQKNSKLDGNPLIVLPPKKITDVMLDLTQDERDVYDMMEKQAQRKFNVFLRRGTVLKNFACILVLLLRLRQACGHPALTIEEGDPEAGAEVDPSFAPCFLDPYSELKRAVARLGQNWVSKTKQRFVKEEEELVRMEKEDPNQAAAPECPICSDPVDDTSRITTCGHVFCQGCLETLFTQTEPIINDGNDGSPEEGASFVLKKPCPNCRTLFQQSDTYLKKAFLPCEDDDDSDGELPGFVSVNRRKMRHGVVEDGDEEEASTSSPQGKSSESTPKGKEKAKPLIPQYNEFLPSTKLVWMLEEIIRVKKECPTDKTIVISQWTAMLGICGAFLTEQGHRFVQYQGDMTSRERDEAVSKFKRMDNVSIMLMSLKCGGVGLNLTCANRVISLDLAWSPASESQAFDRTHRLGQMKNVYINRVMIQNSVEQRICNLQLKKQDLSDNALGEGTGKKLKRLTVSELANLFNLNSNGETLS